MDFQPSAAQQPGSRAQGPGPGSAARHLALQRQKHELRRERDHLVLDLARDLGRRDLAACFGVRQDALDRLLADARDRLAAGSEGPIGARRTSRGPDRWREADEHFAALGWGEAPRVSRGPGAAA